MSADPVIEKAARLVLEERVAESPDARVYWVQGDHGRYLVVMDGLYAACTCPARNESCSHMLAARRSYTQQEATR